jgi:GNAT superfamily N-acetyltransferase
METVPFRKEYLPEAAAIFTQNFKGLRQRVTILPDGLEDVPHVAGMLDSLFNACPGVAALEQGKLAGYMGWFLVDHFRETDRKGAYCPEWAHAAMEESKPAIYRAMYRAASAQWAAAGCQVHAITLLAHDQAALQVWFWNGFGLTVVDAVRPLDPLGITSPTGFSVRKASAADAEILSRLDAEHCQHYTQPPVFMVAQESSDAAAFAQFLGAPHNSVWLAVQGSDPMGFIRFQAHSFGAADTVNADTTIAITGAYTRPAYRGRGAAAALLDAALRDYAGQGFARCSVDFESFNPEAASFWMKYFTPVCLSVIRVPEGPVYPDPRELSSN